MRTGVVVNVLVESGGDRWSAMAFVIWFREAKVLRYYVFPALLYTPCRHLFCRGWQERHSVVATRSVYV